MNRFSRLAAAAALVLLPTGLALAADHDVTVSNGTELAVLLMQATPQGEDGWADLMFGEGMLAAGAETVVTLADPADRCLFDMRFIMENDTVIEAFGHDVCANPAFSLSSTQ